MESKALYNTVSYKCNSYPGLDGDNKYIYFCKRSKFKLVRKLHENIYAFMILLAVSYRRMRLHNLIIFSDVSCKTGNIFSV